MMCVHEAARGQVEMFPQKVIDAIMLFVGLWLITLAIWFEFK